MGASELALEQARGARAAILQGWQGVFRNGTLRAVGGFSQSCL